MAVSGTTGGLGATSESGDGHGLPAQTRDLKLTTYSLNSRGARIYLHILGPFMVVVGIVLIPIFLILLASVGTADGPHTSTSAVIYWAVVYVWVLLTGVLLIYAGIQLPRQGVTLTSDALTIRAFRTTKVSVSDITAIDIGEARLIRQPVIAPILLMRDGQRVAVISLSLRSAPLSPTPPIHRLRPMVEELRSRIGIQGADEEMPHFKIHG